MGTSGMTRDEIIAVTGPIADHFVIQILEAGGHHADLVEAVIRARGDMPDFVAGPRTASPIVSRLSEIIEAADAALEDLQDWQDESR